MFLGQKPRVGRVKAPYTHTCHHQHLELLDNELTSLYNLNTILIAESAVQEYNMRMAL